MAGRESICARGGDLFSCLRAAIHGMHSCVLLSIDTSTSRGSVALLDGDALVLDEVFSAERSHTSTLFPILERARTLAPRLTRIAVGLGPGSYTGIRAAIAVAQGWQLARGIKLLGVSSVAALAAQAQAAHFFGRVNVVVDAQRGEFYLADWEISAESRVEICPLQIVSTEEVQARQAAGERLVGDGAATVVFPTAAAVAQLAAGDERFVSGAELQPIYLRETTFVKAAAARVI